MDWLEFRVSIESVIVVDGISVARLLGSDCWTTDGIDDPDSVEVVFLIRSRNWPYILYNGDKWKGLLASQGLSGLEFKEIAWAHNWWHLTMGDKAVIDEAINYINK